jgi:hypothetical protein
VQVRQRSRAAPPKDSDLVAQGDDLRLKLQTALEPGTREKQKIGWLHMEIRELAMGVDNINKFNANEIFSIDSLASTRRRHQVQTEIGITTRRPDWLVWSFELPVGS